MSFAAAQSQVGNATINEPTNLTLQPLSLTQGKGTSTQFTGRLTDSLGIGIFAKTIHLFVNGIDTGEMGVTDSAGNYTITHTWNTVGVFTYQTKYLGD